MGLALQAQGFGIGDFQIRFYSLAILLGLFAGIFIAQRLARRYGENPDHVLNIAVIGAILGIIGARLYHVFDQQEWPRYRNDPADIIAIWNGGIGIFGAIAGAVLALLLYMRLTGAMRSVPGIPFRIPLLAKREPPLDTLRWLDIGAPAFLLGQAIGRWGNYFNQELFGRPSDLPWAIFIETDQVLREAPEFVGSNYFHPLFLYESLLSFMGLAVLLVAIYRYGGRLRRGDVLLLYLMWYPAVRFGLEFLRTGPWEQGGIPVAQIISGALFVGSLGLLIWRHRRPAPEDPPSGDAAETRRSRSAMRRQRRRASPG